MNYNKDNYYLFVMPPWASHKSWYSIKQKKQTILSHLFFDIFSHQFKKNGPCLEHVHLEYNIYRDIKFC